MMCVFWSAEKCIKDFLWHSLNGIYSTKRFQTRRDYVGNIVFRIKEEWENDNKYTVQCIYTKENNEYMVLEQHDTFVWRYFQTYIRNVHKYNFLDVKFVESNRESS